MEKGQGKSGLRLGIGILGLLMLVSTVNSYASEDNATNSSTWKELVIQVTDASDKIRQLESWDSSEATQLMQSLTLASDLLGDKWAGLKEFSKMLQEGVESGEAQKEDIVQSRDTIADALDLEIGACLNLEATQVLIKTPTIIFNLDWDELHDQAIRMKEISALMPGRIAYLKPQIFNKVTTRIMLYEKMAQALPKIMQMDVQKVLEGKQILEEAQKIAKENQIDTFDSLFQIVFIQAELLSNADLDENERARLLARQQSLISSGGEDSPGFNIYESTVFLKNAAKYIGDGANSLKITNLEEACQSMDEAEKLLESAALALQKGDNKNLMASSISQLVDGYQALVAAQRAYAVALNASIMGTLQAAHVDKLKRYDQDLFKYGEPMKQTLLVMGITPEIATATEKLFETQRTANRNLRHLAETALSPKNLSRIATGMFLVYFVVTVIIIIAALRLSGTIKRLKPTTIISIVVASFAAALIAAFGYQALKFLPIMELLAGGGK
jgi:hypothetical protein